MRVGPGFVKKIRTSQNMKKWLKNWWSSNELENKSVEFHDWEISVAKVQYVLRLLKIWMGCAH